uniref:Predicted protein n=1 Tax=Hordeum vulgare subsp. vulgare TaxID=112509 RepID=F2E7S7_HORVV|nr:predicted protein [Hordeum vulgare subsp. vulgare]
MSTHHHSEPTPAEDKPVLSPQELYAQKWDRCLTKSLQYTVPPVTVGVISLFWSSRVGKFLLLGGTSFGLGMAYAECAFSFKQPDMVHVTRLRKADGNQH